MNILFFDTETTGKTDFKKDYDDPCQPDLCQLGAILSDEKGNEMAKLSLLAKPFGLSWTMSPEAEAVHGMSTEQCKEFGFDTTIILGLFLDLLNKADLVVCHNVQFDALVMRTLDHRTRFDKESYTFNNKNFFCTMRAYTPICKLPKPPKWSTPSDPYKWPKLEEVYRHLFGKTFEGAHDALADVSATKDIYFALDEDLRTQPNITI